MKVSIMFDGKIAQNQNISMATFGNTCNLFQWIINISLIDLEENISRDDFLLLKNDVIKRTELRLISIRSGSLIADFISDTKISRKISDNLFYFLDALYNYVNEDFEKKFFKSHEDGVFINIPYEEIDNHINYVLGQNNNNIMPFINFGDNNISASQTFFEIFDNMFRIVKPLIDKKTSGCISFVIESDYNENRTYKYDSNKAKSMAFVKEKRVYHGPFTFEAEVVEMNKLMKKGIIKIIERETGIITENQKPYCSINFRDITKFNEMLSEFRENNKFKFIGYQHGFINKINTSGGMILYATKNL